MQFIDDNDTRNPFDIISDCHLSLLVVFIVYPDTIQPKK